MKDEKKPTPAELIYKEIKAASNPFMKIAELIADSRSKSKYEQKDSEKPQSK